MKMLYDIGDVTIGKLPVRAPRLEDRSTDGGCHMVNIHL